MSSPISNCSALQRHQAPAEFCKSRRRMPSERVPQIQFARKFITPSALPCNITPFARRKAFTAFRFHSFAHQQTLPRQPRIRKSFFRVFGLLFRAICRSVSSRRNAEGSQKLAIEARHVLITDCQCDLSDRFVRIQEKSLRHSHLARLNVILRRLPEPLMKRAAERRHAHRTRVRHARNRRQSALLQRFLRISNRRFQSEKIALRAQFQR